MTSWFLMLEKILSTILHNIIHPFLQENLVFSQDLPKIFMVLQGGFVISEIVFGCDNPIYNLSPVWKLSMLTQFSVVTTLQSLDLEKQCKGDWPSMILSMRSDDLWVGKAEC